MIDATRQWQPGAAEPAVMLSIPELRYVMLLHEHRNFHKAAAAAGVSQPALSASLARIEKRLDVQLFYRDKQSVTSTVFGDLVARRAALLLNEVANLTEHIAQLRETRAGEVRFGIEPAAADLFLTRALAHFIERHPEIYPGFELDYWEPLRGRLLDGEISFFVGIKNPAFADPDTTSEPFYTQDIVFFSRTGHPLQQLDAVTHRELVQWPLITYRTVLAKRQIRAMLESSEETAQFERNFPVAVVSHLPMIRQLVVDSDYIAMAPRTLFHAEETDGTMKPIDVQDFGLRLTLEIIRRSDHIFSPADEEMIASFRRVRDRHREETGE